MQDEQSKRCLQVHQSAKQWIQRNAAQLVSHGQVTFQQQKVVSQTNRNILLERLLTCVRV